MRCSASSRLSPAPARIAACTCPSSTLRSRVGTLPRSSTTSRSERRCSSCARRRKTRRADAAAARQVVERLGEEPIVHDEHIARILALEHRDEREARRHVGGKILERVHAAVDLPRRERILELLREQPLRADRAQRFVELLVADRLEGDELGLATPTFSSADCTMRACRSASSEARVAIRTGAVMRRKLSGSGGTG